MRGVIYLVWGAKAVEQAKQSIASLRRVEPEMPMLTLGPEQVPYISPFEGKKFLWGRLIPSLYWESPFDETLYLDADAEFVASPNQVFRWLENWELVLAETPNRSLASKMVEEPEMEYSRQMIGSHHVGYPHGGVFAWKRCKAAERFFDIWLEEWLRFQSWDPQVALLRALAKSGVLFLTLPYTWNCKDREEAAFLFHRYGTDAAQAYDWRSK